MRKLIAVLMLGLASVGASAHGPHPIYHSRGHVAHQRYDWVTPMIVGGVVTYALTRPQVVVQQPPVVYQQPQPQTPYGYHYENILDANCNCYRLVLVQN